MKIVPIKDNINSILLHIAPDKSISHRGAIFSLLCEEKCIIHNYLMAQDCLDTLEILKNLGADVKIFKNSVIINPPKEIKTPKNELWCGNSGTSMRIFAGLLSSIESKFILIGDKYLSTRPMLRVANPLVEAGADIRLENNHAPIIINGKKLDYFSHFLQIASAQVKTALILAGLKSNGCKILQNEFSRDHSEIMLKKMGADIKIDGLKIDVLPLKNPLKSFEINVPNDPSSAFYFAILVAIIPNSRIILKNILLNKTRIKAYEVLQKMGVIVKFSQKSEEFEKIGDIEIISNELNGVVVDSEISFLIDEIPALSIAMALANSKSIVKNAKELRVKESDRISSIVKNLKSFGCDIVEFEDGFEISPSNLGFGKIKSFGDHRIAMSFIILALKIGGEIDEIDCIKTSFVDFIKILKDLGAKFEG